MMNLLLSLLFATLQAAAPAPPQTQPLSTPPPNPAYVVGPSDVLNITVFGEAELSRNYSVDGDGTITFPFLSRVPVAGKTVAEIERLLSSMLREGFINKAQVSVTIANFRSRSIFVIGEVRSPARYTIEGQTTLLEVIAQAGSFTPTAGPFIILSRYKDGIAGVVAGTPVAPGDPRGAEVMRVSVDDLREGRLQANVILQDGDTVYVPTADRFYVTGFVRTPGQFVLTPGMTVRQALALAGGISERGSDRGMKIIRKVNNKEIEVEVGMSDPVRPNDTIRIRQRLI